MLRLFLALPRFNAPDKKKRIMKIFSLLLLAMISLPATSWAGESDLKRLNKLFNLAEINGPALVKCSRELDQKRMFRIISFLEQAYTKLNKKFPQYDPPLLTQLQRRFDVVCRTIECRIQEPSPFTSECGWKTDSGMDWIMAPFEVAETEAKTRLTKMGLSVDANSVSERECPRSAQYYQDA